MPFVCTPPLHPSESAHHMKMVADYKAMVEHSRGHHSHHQRALTPAQFRSKLLPPSLEDVPHHRSQPPPTPTRQTASNPRMTELHKALQPRTTSQKARAERIRSTYVNAANLDPPTSQTNGKLGQCTDPNAWAQLLPYRTSTVPQNLSDRIKKSETLPSDVWLHAQPGKISACRSSSSSNKNGSTTPLSYCSPDVNRHRNKTNPSNCTSQCCADESQVRSPPPRPPMRTSSQTSPPSHHQLAVRRKSSPDDSCDPVSNFPPHAVMVDALTDNSPILCRYSQLYSLDIGDGQMAKHNMHHQVGSKNQTSFNRFQSSVSTNSHAVTSTEQQHHQCHNHHHLVHHAHHNHNHHHHHLRDLHLTDHRS